MTDEHQKLVTVVIPTFQRCRMLRSELVALGDQSLSFSAFEAIVVVDGSTDGTLEMLRGLTTPFALSVISKTNGGRAAACNAGIRQASGDVIVLLDDDMLPAPHLLARHLAAHAGDARAAVVGAAPIVGTADSPPVARYMRDKFNAHLQRLASGTPISFRDFYSGNCSIRRRTLLDVGLFDERFRVYGNEDGELAVRLLDAGVELVYAPDALAEQRYPKDFPAVARDHEAKGRTAVILAGMHPAAAASLRLARYRAASRPRFLVRAFLLRASHRWRYTQRFVIAMTRMIERVSPRLALRVYEPVLDYFYWVGARHELRASRARRGTSTMA